MGIVICENTVYEKQQHILGRARYIFSECADLHYPKYLDEIDNTCFVWLHYFPQIHSAANDYCSNRKFGFSGKLAEFSSLAQLQAVSAVLQQV